MSVFDLYPAETQALAEQAAQSPVDPRDMPPAWYSGMGSGLVSGIETGFARNKYATFDALAENDPASANARDYEL